MNLHSQFHKADVIIFIYVEEVSCLSYLHPVLLIFIQYSFHKCLYTSSIVLEIQGKYDKDDPYSHGTHILVNTWNKQTNKKVL